MREPDFDQFSAMLNDVAALLPPAQPLSPTARAIYFRALSTLSIEQVRAGFDAHVKDPQRGRFFPRPADLMAQLQAARDGRPGADEAWAIAVKSADEAATVVWTDEAAAAWGIARPVMALGDEVGARVAFRDAYNRLVDEARAADRPIEWRASLGHDPDGRAAGIREAIALGRLAASQHDLALEGPRRGGQPMLPLLGASGMPEHVRERLSNLRAQLTGEADVEDYPPGPDGIAKQRTEELKAESAKRTRRFAIEQGLPL